MKHKISTLEGAPLDAAVAKAAGITVFMWGDMPVIDGPGMTAWDPSASWDQGGPIIERERITISWSTGEWWAFRALGDAHGMLLDSGQADGRGPTPLVAAMRAYVASRLGDEIDLPA